MLPGRDPIFFGCPYKHKDTGDVVVPVYSCLWYEFAGTTELCSHVVYHFPPLVVRGKNSGRVVCKNKLPMLMDWETFTETFEVVIDKEV